MPSTFEPASTKGERNERARHERFDSFVARVGEIHDDHLEIDIERKSGRLLASPPRDFGKLGLSESGGQLTAPSTSDIATALGLSSGDGSDHAE